MAHGRTEAACFILQLHSCKDGYKQDPQGPRLVTAQCASLTQHGSGGWRSPFWSTLIGSPLPDLLTSSTLSLISVPPTKEAAPCPEGSDLTRTQTLRNMRSHLPGPLDFLHSHHVVKPSVPLGFQHCPQDAPSRTTTLDPSGPSLLSPHQAPHLTHMERVDGLHGSTATTGQVP